MTIKMILSAASAAALLTVAGGAQAQMGAGPPAGGVENQPYPPEATESKTGLPSVDSTRPTGAKAGYTTMPDGRITGEASSAVKSETHMSHDMSAGTSNNMSAGMNAGARSNMGSTDMSAGASSATDSGTMASSGAILAVELVTNGPIPDTEENRARFGGPQSRAGKATEPRGN